MAGPGKRALKRWLPTLRRMLFLVGLANVADALGVEGPPPDLQEFAADTVGFFDRMAGSHEFANLRDVDREAAEAVFRDALEQATVSTVWQGTFDGPKGVSTRLRTASVTRARLELGSDDAREYFDLLVGEVSAKLCQWIEDRPFDTVGLVVAAVRTLTEQDHETKQLLRNIESLLTPALTVGNRGLSRQRLEARARSTRALLRPDVLPPRPRGQDLDPHVIGTGAFPCPVVVTGDGGQGKSVLIGQLFDIASPSRPVLLILASQVPSGAAVGTTHELDEALGRAAYGLPQAPRLMEILETTFVDERPLVLIDTVDLILSDSTADAVSELFTVLTQHCDLVTTCRAREWDDLMPGASARWTDIRIEGLDAEQIVQWTEAFLAGSGTSPDTARAFASSVAAAAHDNRLREVLAVPLRLAMACRLYASVGALPAQLSVTQLYSSYWDTRVARDRRGRRGQIAAEQETAALQLAGDLWRISRARFSDTVAASPATIRVCRTLLSEGILKKVAARYSFFHQTFAEFAVARYLATHGGDDDWVVLGEALADGSAGHWGTATHLLVDDMDYGRFSEVTARVPNTSAAGARLLLRGTFSRTTDEALDDFAEFAAGNEAAVIAAADLVEAAPDEWIVPVLETAIPWLGVPKLQDGVLVNTISALLSRCTEELQTPLLESALRALVSVPGPQLGGYTRAMLHAVIAPPGTPGQPAPAALLQQYHELPDPARRELAALQVAGSDAADDLDVLLTALAEPCPSGAVDDFAALVARARQDQGVRDRLGWGTWEGLLAARYPARWDAVQVRMVVQIAQDDSGVISEIVRAALAGSTSPRDRIHNVIHFLAEQRPREIAAAALAEAPEPRRESAGTLAVLTRTVAPHVDAPTRLALIAQLRRWAAFDPRRVWPALGRSALGHPALLTEILSGVIAAGDATVQRSTFDACINELAASERVHHQSVLRSLVARATPQDLERQAKLDGYLALDDRTARAAVSRHLEAQPNSKRPLAAGRALVEVLASRIEPLGSERSRWLLEVFGTRHDHVVRTVARVLTERIATVEWTPTAVAQVVRRHAESLQRREDAQVASALKDLLGALLHSGAPALARLVTPEVVTTVLDRYFAVLQSVYDDPSTRSEPLTPALYVQLNGTMTRLALPVLPVDMVESYLDRLLVDFDSSVIADGSARLLASTLVGFTTRHPQRWSAVADPAWPRMPDANKMAVAECLKRGSVPDARGRAVTLARRDDCPREVAEALLRAFPD